jgi:hypothetical protein
MVARTLSDEGDDPGLTDRVDPPISEREATAKSDKQSRPGLLTRWTHLSARGRLRPNRTSSEREATAESDKQRERGDGPTGPDREGGDGPRLGWKRREEAGPKLFLRLKSNRVKEN